ncbi:MAG: glycosyltransferase family 2 protein, partial [Phaeodactylibacter sp.]|nr:glycosyltransferase family 2 protein [Phaeodactylibacter sp.]
LIDSLRQLQLQENTVYALDRFTNYCGTWVRHSGWYPDWKVRLFDRRRVQWQGDFVHETLLIPAEFKEVRLFGKLLHYSYRSSEDHWQRIERYARLSAEKLFHRGKKPSPVKKYVSPAARFLRTFFLKKGFLDGKVGWRLSRRNAYMVRRKYQILEELYRQPQDHGN